MQADYIRFLYISIYKFIDVIVISIRSSNFFLTIIITKYILERIYINNSILVIYSLLFLLYSYSYYYNYLFF